MSEANDHISTAFWPSSLWEWTFVALMISVLAVLIFRYKAFTIIREGMHRQAERIRVRAYGHEAELLVEGWPEKAARERVEPSLAWADFLDALSGHKRDPGGQQ